MKIGGFWGLTAPMIVLAFPDLDDAKRLFSTMQNTVNTEIMRNLRTEFYMLSHAGDFAVVDTGSGADALFVRKASTSNVVNGMLMTNGMEDSQHVEFVNELTSLLADMIIKGEAKGKFVKCDGSIAMLRKAVTDWIADKTFELSETRRIVRGLYKSMLSDSAAGVTDRLVDNFGFRRALPESIVVDGCTVHVTESMRSVFRYYLDRLDYVRELADSITADPVKEEEVWGSSFYDLIRRKPQSLRYLIISKFEPAKIKPSAALIHSTVDSVKKGLTDFQKCVEEHVSVYGDNNGVKTLSGAEFKSYLNNFEYAKAKFFSKIQYSDYTVQEFEDLCWIYDRVCRLDESFLNREFELSLSATEWEVLARSMCSLCVCGLNLQSLKLFSIAINTTTLATVDNVKKTKEDLDELKIVLADIESLLSTMRPIGGAL